MTLIGINVAFALCYVVLFVLGIVLYFSTDQVQNNSLILGIDIVKSLLQISILVIFILSVT